MKLNIHFTASSLAFVISLLCSFIFFGSPVVGKDKDYKSATELGVFTQEQILLNQTAAEATQAGDYHTAELIFQTNLRLGEFNVTWLNLGRMYARAGKCSEAREAYQHVLTAPVLSGSEEMQIESKLTQFQEELELQCQGFQDVSKPSKYHIAAWSLFGIGLAGTAAGTIMLAANLPEELSYIDPQDHKDIIQEIQNYNNEVTAYNKQVKAIKLVPLSIGIATLLAGSGMLLADYIKNKKIAPILK